jgi:hypothetical protein
MDDIFSFSFPVIIIFIVAASFGEMAVSGMWLPAYYRYGIPLFRKEYPLTTMPNLAAKIPELEQKLKRSAWRPAVVFRELDKNEIAFRNSFGSKNPLSGLVRLEPSQGRMRISGHLHWTFFLTPLLFFVIFLSSGIPILFLVFLLVIFMMTFAVQRYNYAKIAEVVAETAVSAEPSTISDTESHFYESKLEQSFEEQSKPIESYQEYDYEPYNPTKPQSGLNRTESILILALVALVVMAGVAAFLLFGGG